MLEFKKYNFNFLNETDIREEIVAPFLKALGYRSGTKNNIVREQSLRYPYAQLGKKKLNKDPLLRGKADYICEIVDGPRWTIEVKSPSINISINEIEQAYSYAVHPEIRAAYFCITNGKIFLFYQTNQGPTAQHILEVTYENLEESFTTINNLVGPEALIRDYGKVKIDIGKPLGPGLRSIGRISNGFIKYTQANIHLPALLEMIMSIQCGSVERDDNNNLLAYLEVISPFQSLQELNEKLGLEKLEMRSTDSTLSIDPKIPTQFDATKNIILPAGIPILDIHSWKRVILPANVSCETKTIAKGYLRNNKFLGEFQTHLFYKNYGRNINLKGEFEIFIT